MQLVKSTFIVYFIGCVFLCTSAFAEQWGDYQYTESEGALTITRYTGSGGVVVIPSVIEDKPVVGIGDSAFNGCTGLTSVTIMDGVISIGRWAFYGCTGLTSITIPGSVASIGHFAFLFCTGLTSVTIPASVTSIGWWAFEGCTGLTAAYFYGHAPAMGANVFLNCASGFTVYNTAGGAGFTNPWYGYTTSVFIPPATSIARTATTKSVEPAITLPQVIVARW
jgi:hypothetical protein